MYLAQFQLPKRMNDLRSRFVAKSDEQLLKIVTSERNDYTPEATQLAETILKERSVAFHAADNINQVSEVKSPEPSRIYLPLIGGIGMVLLAFVDPIQITDADAAFTINLTINIFIRFIVVMWLLDLTKTFHMNRILWVILGLIFGGWALIAANLAIWMTEANLAVQIPDHVTDNSTAQESSDHNKLHNLNFCPACNTPLNGNEEVCPGCDLSLK